LKTAPNVTLLHIICYTALLSEAVKQIFIGEILQVFNEGPKLLLRLYCKWSYHFDIQAKYGVS